MKIDATTEKGFKRIVNFELEESELDKHRKSAFNKIRKTAKIDGFRPGKAPESLIKKRYGASIESDALTEAANGLIREYLVENKIYPLSEPVINSVNNEGDILKLNVSFEIYPEFELGDFTGLTVEKEKFTITDKDIEEEIAQLLEKHSSSKEVSEPVSDGHIVEVSIKQAGLEGADWEKQTVEIGKNADDTIDKQFMGLKKGDTKTLDLSDGKKGSPSVKFDIRIDKVSKKITPEFNDDFAKAYDKKFSTVKELRKEIIESIKKKKTKEEENVIYDKIAAKITEGHDTFEVPDTVLNKYLEDIVTNTQKQYGKNLDREMIKNIYGENAKLSLKWEYIRHKIIDKLDMTVTDEELESRLKEISDQSSVDIEKVKKYYSGKDKSQMLKNDILERKLREYLIGNNKVDFVEKPLETEDEQSEKSIKTEGSEE